MKGYSEIFLEKMKEKEEYKNKNQYENLKKSNLNSLYENNINQNVKDNIIKLNKSKINDNAINFRNFPERQINRVKDEFKIINNFKDSDGVDKNNNENDLLIKRPTVSLINKQNNINDSYNNSNIYLKKNNLNDNNKRYNNIFDNIDPNKEILYNFGYKKQDRLEPLKLSLIEDSIKEQELEYQRQKMEIENLKKKFEELYLNESEKRRNKCTVSKTSTISKKTHSSLETNNYEHLSKIVEEELNLTKNQMNILDKEANLLYNKYNKHLKEKCKLIKYNDYSRNNRFLSKLGKKIIIKNDYSNNKYKINTNKEISVPIPLLMSCMGNQDKRNINLKKYYNHQKLNFFSPNVNNRINFFQDFNKNNINGRRFQKNFSEIIENKNSMF